MLYKLIKRIDKDNITKKEYISGYSYIFKEQWFSRWQGVVRDNDIEEDSSLCYLGGLYDYSDLKYYSTIAEAEKSIKIEVEKHQLKKEKYPRYYKEFRTRIKL